MMSRLGVLGGMFDPVHAGHVGAARFAVRLLRLERLKMVPLGRPGHRPEARGAAAHRLAMLALATEGDGAIEVDDIEIRRGGVSRTVDTLERLRGAARRIVFVLGLDAFNTLPRWRRPERILDLCHLLVLGRGGVAADAEAASALGRRRAPDPEALFEAPAGGILLSDGFRCGASSTRVREALAAGADAGPALDGRVLDYIRRHGLYRRPPRREG